VASYTHGAMRVLSHCVSPIDASSSCTSSSHAQWLHSS